MNQNIFNLWLEAVPDLRGDRVPKFVLPPQHHPLLFLSLNPSYPQHLPTWILQQGLDAESFLWEAHLRQHNGAYNPVAAHQLAQLHHAARNHYPRFFRRINAIAMHLGHTDYSHLDLFLRLDHAYKNLPRDFRDPANHLHPQHGPLNFVQAQLSLATDLIYQSHPQAIISVFPTAADILINYWHSRFPGQQQQDGWEVLHHFGRLTLKRTYIHFPGRPNPLPIFRCPVMRWMGAADFNILLNCLQAAIP